MQACERERLNATKQYDRWFVDHFASFEAVSRQVDSAFKLLKARVTQGVELNPIGGAQKRSIVGLDDVRLFFAYYNEKLRACHDEDCEALIRQMDVPPLASESRPLLTLEQIRELAQIHTTNLSSSLKEPRSEYRLFIETPVRIRNEESHQVEYGPFNLRAEMVVPVQGQPIRYSFSLLNGSAGSLELTEAAKWAGLIRAGAQVDGKPVQASLRYRDFYAAAASQGRCDAFRPIPDYQTFKRSPEVFLTYADHSTALLHPDPVPLPKNLLFILRTDPEAQHGVHSLAISPDRSLIVGGGEADLYVWKRELDGNYPRYPTQKIPAHHYDVTGLQFSADGRSLFSTGSNGNPMDYSGEVKVWPVLPDGSVSETPSQAFKAYSQDRGELQLSANGLYLGVFRGPEWSAFSRESAGTFTESRREFESHDRWYRKAAFDPVTGDLYLATEGGQIFRSSRSSGGFGDLSESFATERGVSAVSTFAFAPDGWELLIADERALKIFHRKEGQSVFPVTPEQVVDLPAEISAVRISPDRSFIVMEPRDGREEELRFYVRQTDGSYGFDTAVGQLTDTLEWVNFTWGSRMQLSADGEVVVNAGANGLIHVWGTRD